MKCMTIWSSPSGPPPESSANWLYHDHVDDVRRLGGLALRAFNPWDPAHYIDRDDYDYWMYGMSGVDQAMSVMMDENKTDWLDKIGQVLNLVLSNTGSVAVNAGG